MREDGAMARPWSRKRGNHSDIASPPAEPSEAVRLDTADNAWWSQAELERVWAPKPIASSSAPRERDILAEHFGDDWRTNLGVDGATDDGDVLAEDVVAEGLVAEGLVNDPYTVLRVDPAATWDEIVAAHRREARVHHPDRLFGRSEAEKAQGEEHIRRINAAYQELRIRRGM